MPELSASTYSETDSSNSSASPNGWPEGMPPGGVNDSDRALAGAVKRFWGRIQGKYASSAGSNNYAITPDVALAAYVTGERYSFRADFTNTGSATLNISGIGARTIKKMTGVGKANLAAGDIQNGQPVTVEADTTDLIMVTPVAGDSTNGTVTSVGSGEGLTGGPIESIGSLSLDVNGLTEDTAPNINDDFVATYDTSDTSHKKVLLNKLTTGKQMQYIPAASMRPAISNGCGNLIVEEGTAGRPNRRYLPFDSSAEEHAQFDFTFPNRWNGGTISFIAHWTADHNGTGGVAWALRAVAVSDGEPIDTAFGNAVTVTDNGQSAAWDNLRTAESGAITIAGVPGDGDAIQFDIFRDPLNGADTITLVDVGLVGIELFWTSDQGNDA